MEKQSISQVKSQRNLCNVLISSVMVAKLEKRALAIQLFGEDVVLSSEKTSLGNEKKRLQIIAENKEENKNKK